MFFDNQENKIPGKMFTNHIRKIWYLIFRNDLNYNTCFMKKFKFIFLLTVSWILASCTTVQITESDAFDAHRTIFPDLFSQSGIELHDISIDTEDGETLDAWFFQREDAVATVVYFGGNGFLMVKSRPLIEAYATVPVNLLLFDYRGYGQSTGDPTVAGIREDAVAAFNFVKNLQDDDHPIYVHGHSIGSFLSAFVADEYDTAGYILESPITDVHNWTRKMVPWIARIFIRFDIDDEIRTQNNTERVERIEKPLLIMGGSNDEITPFQMAESLYESSPSSEKTLVRITGGSHNDLPKSVEYRRALAEFFGQ